MERHPIDLTDIATFLRVAELGGFSRAAERLGVAKSVVSRRVSQLERGLGARLLTRSSKGAQLTDVGQAYLARVSQSLAELEAAQEEVAVAVSEVAGSIRLTAPLTFGVRHLAPLLARFATLHHRVELDISFDDRPVDLLGGGFDLAVRIGNLPDSALTARRLAPVHRVALASPDYLARRGRPERPRDLSHHDALLYANGPSPDRWRFRVGDRWERVRVQGRLRADNGDMLVAAAAQGLGVTILPTFIASDAIASGTLEPLLTDFPIEDTGLHAVMPPGRSTTARVRALVDFLAGSLGPEPSWDPCWTEQNKRAPR